MSSSRRRDAFRLLAASAGYVARSGFKLASLQASFRLVPRGGTVLDLGCSPGAWLQAASQAAGPTGRVIGVDVTRVSVPGRLCHPGTVTTVAADAASLTPATLRTLAHLPSSFTFDAVLSDMCGATTGVADVDGERSAALVRVATRLACGVDDGDDGDDGDDSTHSPSCTGLLRLGGNFCAKSLESDATPALVDALRRHFHRVVRARPPATRAASREIYVVGLGRKA